MAKTTIEILTCDGCGGEIDTRVKRTGKAVQRMVTFVRIRVKRGDVFTAAAGGRMFLRCVVRGCGRRFGWGPRIVWGVAGGIRRGAIIRMPTAGRRRSSVMLLCNRG